MSWLKTFGVFVLWKFTMFFFFSRYFLHFSVIRMMRWWCLYCETHSHCCFSYLLATLLSSSFVAFIVQYTSFFPLISMLLWFWHGFSLVTTLPYGLILFHKFHSRSSFVVVFFFKFSFFFFFSRMTTQYTMRRKMIITEYW